MKTIVQKFARQKHTIKVNGRPRKVTTAELLLMAAAQLSLDHIEADKLLEQLRKRIAPVDRADIGVLLVPEDLDIEEWVRRQTILNQFRKPPSTLGDPEDKED